jgi:protoporphyrinogen/coproporphyrinogen III oxidase
MRAIVVGAGMAGLAAGHRLQSAGWEVILLEKGAQVGGRVRTSRREGYLIEHGATQICTGYRAYLELAELLGIRGEVVPCSNIIGLMRGGKVYEIDGRRPILAAFSGALSLGGKMRLYRAARDYMSLDPPVNVLVLSDSYAADTESALDYSNRRLNREIYDVLVDPLIRAYTLNRADGASVVEWFSCLRNLLGQEMLALKGGMQRLPCALASVLNVRLNAAVTAVNRLERSVTVSVKNGSGLESMLEGDACIIATQLPDALKLAPDWSASISTLSETLTYNSTVVVHLGFHKRTHSRAIGILVGAQEHAKICLVWLEHNKLASSVPDEGHSLFSIYFDNTGLNSIAPNSDEVVVRIALAFIVKLFPELDSSLHFQEVTRWAAAIPNPTVGVYKAIHEMRERLDPDDPVQIAGDFLTCTGQNSAIHWGLVAADNLIRAGTRRASCDWPESICSLELPAHSAP